MGLAEACKRHPFSNGTEGQAWMDAWCGYCVHDHGMTHHDSCGVGCDLIFNSMMPEFPSLENPWPEAWLPEPDDGKFFLPSRMICGKFEPCTLEGCDGDEGADDRAERVAEVTLYWKENR